MDNQKPDQKALETKPVKRSGAKKKDFLVVGLGASAGGVKALQEFFARMPADSGMAFVVVLHLSPEHASNLPEILQKHTSMRVVAVEKTVKVQPNRVYVISPNTQLELTDGVIRAAAPAGNRGVRVAIDIFFRTLAETYAKNSVCIVLSGTGTDGTLGLKAVKEANGFAIVQDPADAEYDSMPQSAISTGIVDWILPVAKMPERLIQFRDSSEELHLVSDEGDEKVERKIQADESLREILTALRVRTGHDFSHYKTPTLVRRIARHLQIHDLPDIPSYLEFLREKPDEINFLLKNLLINVTNFFRDKEAWESLEREIVPKLFSGKRAGDTVRGWSCACASGEEAYSLAMLLAEYAESLPDPPKIQVFASDVDRDAVAEARAHIYPQSIEADVSPARLKRFFIKEGKFYRVKNEIREMVLFAPHNVLRDPPFSRLDLIVCRNLLIYLNRETQERVMEIFHFALNSHGHLFLGSSETAEAVPALFFPADKKHRIYLRRRAHLETPGVPPRMPLAGRWEIKMPAPGKRSERTALLDELHYKLIESLAPPSILINQDFEVQYMTEGAGRFLSFRGGEPSNNLLRLINTDLLPDLRAALFHVQREKKTVQFKNIRVAVEGTETFVSISILPVEIEGETTDYVLVVFDENDKFVPPEETYEVKQARISDQEEKTEAVVERLEDELTRTKEVLRATIEQHEVSIEELKASNEELQAINEELRSTTEELETSKEELQSVNEELTTVNQEHREKIDETMGVISDLQNLMASTDIATIFLDRRLRIKRLTPPVRQLFNISEADKGRPLEHFTHHLQYENLSRDAARVLETLVPIEQEVRDDQNRTFLARLLPYRTIDDRIEGVVINFVDITERKRAGETRSFLASIVESSEDSIITVNFEGVITSWNRAAERLYGYTAREAVGSALAVLTLPADIERLFESIGEIKNHRRVETYDSVRVRKDGHELNLEVVFSPVHGDAGKVIGVSIIARDVTNPRSEFEALRFSESRLQKAIAINTVGIYFFKLDGTILEANEAFLEIMGFTLDELRARGEAFWESLTPPEFHQAPLKARRELARRGDYMPYERLFQRSDGALRWGLFAGKRLNGKECVEFVIDITESKLAAEEKRRTELRLRQMMESVSDYAIIFTDVKGRVTSWNTGAEKIFGWTEREMLGQSADIIFVPEDRAEGAPEKERESAARHGRAEDERYHLHKTGKRFYVSGVMTPLRDGELEGFVKICRDQTARLEAEQSIQEKEMLRRLVVTQEEERRRIARDIHDHFGQQITALRLQLDALKKATGDNEALAKIAADAERTAAVLDADVDFIAWELRPASLDDLGLPATLTNFVTEWSNHTGIQAEFHSTGLSRTRLQYEIETNLYRIAQEALNNIQKHSGAAKASVLLEKSRSKVSLIIEDDGVGFNPRDKANRRRGIGLTGMIERAKICGGTLEIESAKGKGTTIFVRVPLKKLFFQRHPDKGID